MCLTTGELKKTLQSLPTTLGETYERILDRIPEHRCKYVLHVLQWLAFSARPLTLRELAAALEVNIVDGSPVNDDDHVQDPQAVLNMCSSLVTISPGRLDKDDVQVQLSHLSVQNYLTSEQIHKGKVQRFSFSAQSAHTLISQTCLFTLLRLDNPEGWESMAALNSPLALYAEEYWIQHVFSGDISSTSEVEGPMRALFQPTSAQYINWIRLWDMDSYSWNHTQLRRSSSTIAPPLYYASRAGLREISGWLLEKNTDVHAQGGRYCNALQAASHGGHEAVVRLLLEKNADIHAQGGEYGNALQAASYGGHEAVVRLLLEKNADIHAQGGGYGNALQAASHGGHEAVVRLLLEKSVDVHAQGGYYGNALQAASLGGHEAVVRLLLEKNADFHAQGGYYGTALQAASASGYETVVRLLLEQNADVN